MVLKESTFIKSLANSTFFVKLTNWEFWSFNVVYTPVILYYLWLSVKARSLFFFTASNPGIENSGFIGESKSGILEKIDNKYLPKYIIINPGNDIDEIELELNKTQITFPIILKPDVGERGAGIEKISDENQLRKFVSKIQTRYLIQEYIDFPLEAGIFYYRMPGAAHGTISSVVIKGYLNIVGDGIKTLAQWVEEYPRARFRKDYLKEKFKDIWNTIVPENQEIVLENIGNHCRGTMFLDGNAFINSRMLSTVEDICKHIQGFYFGRFDLKCSSWENFYQGKDIKILELNGAGSEPGHIYQPGFSFWEGQKVLRNHWKALFDISMENHSKGVRFITFKEARDIALNHKKALKKLNVK